MNLAALCSGTVGIITEIFMLIFFFPNMSEYLSVTPFSSLNLNSQFFFLSLVSVLYTDVSCAFSKN
jgi:hypothetical protein